MRTSRQDTEETDVSRASTIRAMPVLGLFLLISSITLTDIVLDWQAGGELMHLLSEAALTTVTLAGSAWIGSRLLAERRAAREALQLAKEEAAAAEARAEASAEEAQRWRGEAQNVLAGLGVAIDRQFKRWALTPAEAEVALLLLKGLSTKEIAGVRDTSDATVRQQARSVYSKGALSGRAELSAFFLEDLLLPIDGE